MPTAAKEKFTVLAPGPTATDAELEEAVAAITTNAPDSDVYKGSTQVQAGVAVVLALAKDWTDSRNAVAADESKLEADKGLRKGNRGKLVKKLGVLRTLIEDAAPTAADARAVGFKTRDKNATPAPIAVPAGGVLTPSKKVKGQFTASAAAVPGIENYAMQVSTDGINYTTVDGTAKRRTFKGYASGAHVWVRFAAVRGHAQSDWSVPQMIVIP